MNTEPNYPFATFDRAGHLRRSGKTTRLVDEAIQNLFSGKEVTVVDHYTSPESPIKSNAAASEFLLKQILRRLYNEHQIDFGRGHIKLLRRRKGGYTVLQLVKP